MFTIDQHQLAAARSTRRCRTASSRWRRATNRSCMTPFTLAGAMAPITLAGALAQQNAEALAGIACLPDRAARRARSSTAASPATSTCSRGPRRSARPSTGHGDGRRPTGTPLQPAVPQQQRVRRQRRRCPGRVRERVLAVGLRAGRRQHDDARRRLDGGRAARQLRARWCSTPICCTWCRRCWTRSSSTTTRWRSTRSTRSVPADTSSAPRHTQARYRSAFYKPMISDWRNYENGTKPGSPEAAGRRHELAAAFLAAYEEPPMDA